MRIENALAAALIATALVLPPPSASAQEAEVAETTLTLSSEVAGVELTLSDGAIHTVRFRGGEVEVDGRTLGSYEPGGALERAWRELLAEGLRGAEGFRLDASRLAGWAPPRDEAPGTARALDEALDRILGVGGPSDGEPGRQAGGETRMTGPGGQRLSVAPGGLPAEELRERLGRLESRLSRLGSDAAERAEDLALVVHDDHEIPSGRSVAGNLALLGGELRLGGRVEGDVLVLDGTLLLEPPAHVTGDLLRVGGSLRQNGGRVDGELLSVRSTAPSLPSDGDDWRDAWDDWDDEWEEAWRDAWDDWDDEWREALRDRFRGDLGFFGRMGRNLGRALGGVVGVVALFLLLGLAGVATVYFAGPRLEVAADTVRHSFLRSFGVGLAGEFLFLPVLLVLVVAVVTWLLIPFYLAAAALASLAGFLAVALAAAGIFDRREPPRPEWIDRIREHGDYTRVLAGLAVLLLPFALAESLHLLGGWMDWFRGITLFLLWTGLWVLGTAGFGAVLLSRAGQRTDYARPRGPAPTPGARGGGDAVGATPSEPGPDRTGPGG